MLNHKSTKRIKATIEYILVAFIYTVFFLAIINILFKNEINSIISTINLISINNNYNNNEPIKFNLESKNLETYPSYSTQYANLKIPTLNIDLKVFYGDTLAILKEGIGHSSGSYFPGEGGSILYMGHNTNNMLKDLKEITNDTDIIIETSYGIFTYKVYDTKIINYKDLDEVPINRDSEILMLYTCYQSLTFGHTPKRFITYAKLEQTIIKEDNL